MEIFTFLHNILLLGILQGFIICFLLFFTGPKHTDASILAKILLFFTLVCLNQYLYDSEWMQQNPYLNTGFYLVPLMVIMPIGPLIYQYIKTQQEPTYVPNKKERLWSLLIVIDMVPYVAAWIFLTGVLLNLLKNNPGPWGLFIDRWQQFADIPRWLSLTGGLFFSWRYIIKKNAPKNEKWAISFLKVFTIFLVLWLLQLILYMFPILQPLWWNKIAWYSIYVPLVILIYWLGLCGFLQSRSEKKRQKEHSLPLETFREINNLIIQAMETDLLYLNPDLNLSMLAQKINIPQKTISTILNQYEKKGFSEFVNNYRVEAFKKKVTKANLSLLTIIGVAQECGFSSQSTFQRIFKQTTGMSPSEYLKQYERTNK